MFIQLSFLSFIRKTRERRFQYFQIEEYGRIIDADIPQFGPVQKIWAFVKEFAGLRKFLT